MASSKPCDRRVAPRVHFQRRGSEREKYTSTFANRYGEEWIFEYDRVTGVGWLKGSDVDWQTYQVIDGRVNALILNSEELYYRGTVPKCPAELEPAVEERIRQTALTAYRALGVRDYGRVDIRLSPEGTPYVLDVNPNPDISPKAGLARATGVAGMSYTQLIERIVALGLARSSAYEYQEASAVGQG